MKNKGILIAKSPELENCRLSYSEIMNANLVYYPLTLGGAVILKNRWGQSKIYVNQKELESLEERAILWWSNHGPEEVEELTEEEREVFLEDYKSLQESCHDMKRGQLVMCALARTNKYAHTYAMENGLDCYYDESKILPLLMEIL